MKRINKDYFIRKIIKYALHKQEEKNRWYIYNDCAETFRRRLENNNISVDEPAQGEDGYVKFWQQFCDRVEPYTYRYFSRIVGPNPHIVPEDIANIYIESLLNPPKYRAYYSDKNMYSKYITPSTAVPRTYLQRVAGGLIQSEKGYFNFSISAKGISELIGKNVNRIVIKPSIDSHGGSRVMLFQKENDIFLHEGTELSGSFLSNFGRDFVIQEVIKQHEYLNRFCKSSCNTMRILTYRSFVDEEVIVFGALLRIGHEGAFVDNITSGGGFIPIDVDSGKIGNIAYDDFARPITSINNVDFSKEVFVLPFWNDVLSFAKKVAEQTTHLRLLAQDIIIDNNNNARLIEFNVDGFWWGASMYSGRIPLGNRFNEVIDYCLDHKKEIDA